MTGEELVALRKKAGWRAYKLAMAIEVSPAMLSKYERGHAPIPKKVELAARYLCEKTLVPKEPLVERLKAVLGEVME